MPHFFDANEVIITIAGQPHVGILSSYQSSMGSRPASADIILVHEFARSFQAALFEGQQAQVTVDGQPLIDGFVMGTTPRLSDDSVTVRILDKRWFLNKTWFGRNHLGTNGLPLVGADIIFNEGGRPNKDFGGIRFVFENGNVSDEVCAIQEGEFWTYGNILEWVWQNYVTDIPLPSIPQSGGLERRADEMNFFGSPIGQVIDEIFNRTNSNWCLDGSGFPYIFSRVVPAAFEVIRIPDPSFELSNEDYSLEYPIEFSAPRSIEGVVTSLDVVGGREIRERTFSSADFEAAKLVKEIQPSSSPIPAIEEIEEEEEATTIIELVNWSNFRTEERYAFTLNKQRYEILGLGKNIRRKDKAKPLTNDLITKRNREGEFVPPDNECGIFPVQIIESLGNQYPQGYEVDLDKGTIYVPKIIGQDLPPDPPIRFTAGVQTEIRTVQTVSSPLATMPSDVFRAAIRQEFIQRERITGISVDMPVNLLWTIIVTTSVTGSVVVTPAVPIPLGAVLDPPNVNTAGNGWEIIGFTVPRTSWTVTLPAAVEFDAVAALAELGALAEPELGRPAVNVEATYPSFKNILIGSKISVQGVDFGMTGEEIVVAVSFEGENQTISFSATNHIGADGIALARSFLDRRRFGRRI